ncbi:KxYKxGKxW signal peptide domain-containing protein [Lactiplantibacillus plantarum]|uniref:KxYKxGKxW signal peptide domain-containing protein n=1 Tax=Lactiplantibacillus plantarum TaxID=1590 RepID=UPI00345EE51E
MSKKIYVGELKTHYKLVKKGKSWVVIGITTFSVGLSVLFTNYSIHADSVDVENDSIDSSVTGTEFHTVTLKSSVTKNNDSNLNETNEGSQEITNVTSIADSQSSNNAASSSGLKSIFETGFKRHSEPRLPSTAQINH